MLSKIKRILPRIYLGGKQNNKTMKKELEKIIAGTWFHPETIENFVSFKSVDHCSKDKEEAARLSQELYRLGMNTQVFVHSDFVEVKILYNKDR